MIGDGRESASGDDAAIQLGPGGLEERPQDALGHGVGKRRLVGLVPDPGQRVHPDRGGQRAATTAAQADAAGQPGHRDHLRVASARQPDDLGGAAERPGRKVGRVEGEPVLRRPDRFRRPRVGELETGEELPGEHVFGDAQLVLPFAARDVIAIGAPGPGDERGGNVPGGLDGHADGAVPVGPAPERLGAHGEDGAPEKSALVCPLDDPPGQQLDGALLVVLEMAELPVQNEEQGAGASAFLQELPLGVAPDPLDTSRFPAGRSEIRVNSIKPDHNKAN